MNIEKEYKDFNKCAKKGADKYAGLRTSAMMKKYAKAYEKKTRRNAYNIYNKEHFYCWVSKNTVK